MPKNGMGTGKNEKQKSKYTQKTNKITF